jgi:hypothetical protein
VSDELERRLRDSLRAYADLVEAPADDALPTVRTRSRPALRRWRGAILAAAAAAAVVTGSVWAVSDRDGDSTSAAGAGGSAMSAQDDTGAGAPGSDGGAAAAESQGLADSAAPAAGFPLPSLEVGVTYPVDLYTHCGVLGLDIGGVWFAADRPLVEEYGPPDGWGNPDQPGTITMLTHDTAVFRDDAGHDVSFHADEAGRPPPCA